jgi:hypothetical protein
VRARRSISNLSDGSGRRGQLREHRRPQAAVASEQPPLGTEDRPGGESRQLIVAVGFVERLVRDPEPAESLEALKELAFVGNAADN